MDIVIVNKIVYDKKLYLLIGFSFSVGQFQTRLSIVGIIWSGKS